MQYIIDNSGVKTAVIVPYIIWEKLNSDYKKLQNKLDVFSSVIDGFDEINSSRKNGTKLQTLSEFLNESDS